MMMMIMMMMIIIIMFHEYICMAILASKALEYEAEIAMICT